MWSISGRSGTSSQLGWKQVRSRTSMARRRAPREEAALRADVEHPGAAVEHDALDVGLGEVTGRRCRA